MRPVPFGGGAAAYFRSPVRSESGRNSKKVVGLRGTVSAPAKSTAECPCDIRDNRPPTAGAASLGLGLDREARRRRDSFQFPRQNRRRGPIGGVPTAPEHPLPPLDPRLQRETGASLLPAGGSQNRTTPGKRRHPGHGEFSQAVHHLLPAHRENHAMAGCDAGVHHTARRKKS